MSSAAESSQVVKRCMYEMHTVCTAVGPLHVLDTYIMRTYIVNAFDYLINHAYIY